ncbi:hypothetical protein [Labedella populi]|uniref:hypothetical protein n=1 Tax=Labedella populi TaxID=2498850 RepID=UPI001FB5E653|nr:hypothetical protein [Labedella populi]
MSGTRKSSHDADWNAAIAAAYAGVEDYKSRLSNDNTYVRYGDPGAVFSAGSDVRLPTEPNDAFGSGIAGTWASVPGSTNGAQFRYEVDNRQYEATGSLRVRSSGRVGDVVRTIVVNVKQEGFVDYLYFTDYEMTDPILTKNSRCVPAYAWSSPYNQHPSYCTDIQFAANDVINGPLHSNDTVLVCGQTKFRGEFTTANSVGDLYKKVGGWSCPGDPVFTVKPKVAKSVGMPKTNSQMLSETRTDLDTVQRPGCLYTGPTIITLTSDGQMNVKSPFTKQTRILGEGAADGSTPPECGAVGTATGQLGSEAGATIDVIPQNLIYVQNVPDRSTNVNYWPTTTNPTSFSCTDGNSWLFGSSVRYPAVDEEVPYASPAHYGCRNGDVYVKGTLDGEVTLAAQNYIYVTGDLRYESASDDVLGLVGENSVWVHKPVKCTSWNEDRYGRKTTCSNYENLSSTKDRRIDAAILSVAHTFIVQNHDKGDGLGTLTVMGAIAQKFRGPVATTGGTGYVKSYSYDPRFKYMAPPKFLSPVSTTYGVSEIVEVKTAFNPDGSPA